MTTTTIDLYTALVEANVEKEKARAAAEAVISREEAQHFATKADIADVESDIKALDAKFDIMIGINPAVFAGVLVLLLQTL